MKKFDYKKFLPKAVVIILCLFFVGGVIWGGISIMTMEGTMVPYTPSESLSERPVTQQATVDYLNGAIAKALEAKPKVSSEEKFRIDSDAITCEPENNRLVAVAGKIKDDVQKAVEDTFESPEADYGAGLDGIIKSLNLSPDDILSAECKCEYYVCPICSEESDEKTDVCEECGGEEEPLLRYRDEYTVRLSIKPDSNSFKNNFLVRSNSDINEIIDANCGDFFTCKSISSVCNITEITAKVNRLSDKLTKLTFRTEAVTAAMPVFTGVYSSLGEIRTEFAWSDEFIYELTWPGVELNEHTISVEPGKTEALKATLTCDDPTKYDVVWSSSDETIAGVDENGYVKPGKQTGSAVITAEFRFGETVYSDSCTVNVRYSVEELDVSPRSLVLTSGEQKAINAKVSPRKATIKTVKWYSEDISVATVDAHGTVTAVSPGNTVIYALSDDGYYKSSCRVEVTK